MQRLREVADGAYRGFLGIRLGWRRHLADCISLATGMRSGLALEKRLQRDTQRGPWEHCS
ncbi:MAG: hypothetical protein CMJ59_18415 [Planctomycetaceae bacterium]|nr:hypothetical protein [Planctomycetaceae bacterium]